MWVGLGCLKPGHGGESIFTPPKASEASRRIQLTQAKGHQVLALSGDYPFLSRSSSVYC